jgi:hypothetical protein
MINEQNFTTLDAYLSGYLAIKGFKPNLISQPGTDKLIFSFKSSPKLLDTINAYNEGGEIGALRFAVTIKALRSQIYSLRRREHDREEQDFRTTKKTNGRAL